jgi:hypothetical protein
MSAAIALITFSAAAPSWSTVPNQQVSHGIVTNWEHFKEQSCAYVQIEGRKWYSTRIILALDGFATLQAIGQSENRKTPIAFTVLPSVGECGPLPGIKVWVVGSSHGRRR